MIEEPKPPRGTLVTRQDILAADPSDMYGTLRAFPEQVEEAIRIGRNAILPTAARGIRSIVLSGLGGSAIGGDLLRSLLAREMPVPFIVNRNYRLPAFVNRSSLVIISSYSGNTEETIAAFAEARRRRARIVCISSGGEIERLSHSTGIPLITIPGGLHPRAALGYSFFPLLILLNRLGFVTTRRSAMPETLTLLRQKTEIYSNPDGAANQAVQIATLLRNHLSVVYSSTERFDAVATRWRGQIAENAKSLMFGHVLPEMNHNELVGWSVLSDLMKEIRVIFLRDREDHERVQIRMEITKDVLAHFTPSITEVWSEGRSPLARMFSLVSLGDWVSFYTAVQHGVDPTPVRVIDRLKEELSKTRQRRPQHPRGQQS